MGLTPMFWASVAELVGRRPVYLLSYGVSLRGPLRLLGPELTDADLYRGDDHCLSLAKHSDSDRDESGVRNGIGRRHSRRGWMSGRGV